MQSIAQKAKKQTNKKKNERESIIYKNHMARKI